jgi:hypothetical protein
MAHSFARLAAPASLLAACTVIAACAETSPSGVVVAPMTSGAPAPAPVPEADASADAGPDPDASPPVLGGGAVTSAPAQFRACMADADCVVVPRVGCCHNGWNEAVAASQRGAYAASFHCPNTHPMCAMFIVRDSRVARCDAQSHLCTMVNARPTSP